MNKIIKDKDNSSTEFQTIKLLPISFINSIITKPTIGNAKKSLLMELSRMEDSSSRETEVMNKVTSSLLLSLSKKIRP